jgi:hypothetical protein
MGGVGMDGYVVFSFQLEFFLSYDPYGWGIMVDRWLCRFGLAKPAHYPILFF